MDFARKQLEKYGWTDGKGLGKNENGISEAIKPKLKRSVAGIGHDAASDFTEHWWTQLYDKAADNLEVKKQDGKIEKIKSKEDFEITNSTWKMKRKKKDKELKSDEPQYSEYFVKKAVLTKEGVKVENVDSDDDEETVETDVFKMTDEELFAACGGRTAHKGARHGLKALGKLARIEEQEKLLLEDTRFEGYSHKKEKRNKEIQKVEDTSFDTELTRTKKKSKKIHCNRDFEVETQDSSEKSSDNELTVSKKKIKRDVEVETQGDSELSETSFKKKNKKRNNDIEVENEQASSEMSNDSETISKKKSKKRNRDTEVEKDKVSSESDNNVLFDELSISKKKSKKREDIEVEGVSKSKKKKKKDVE